MGLAPFTMTSRSDGARTQREVDAVASSEARSGDLFEGYSQTARENVKNSVGPENLLISGFDTVFNAGKQAGEEGDVEAAALARDFIESQMQTPEMKKAMANAMSYSGPMGADPIKDQLKIRAIDASSNKWSAALNPLASELTNPNVTKYRFEKAFADQAVKNNPMALASTLNQLWEETKNLGRSGDVKGANDGRAKVLEQVAKNRGLLDSIFQLPVDSKDTKYRGLALAGQSVARFLDGSFMKEDSELFNEKTNPQSKTYKIAQKMALGHDALSAEVYSSPEEGFNQSIGAAAITYIQGLGYKDVNPYTGVVGDKPVSLAVSVFKKAAESMAQNGMGPEDVPARLNALASNLSGVAPSDLDTTLKPMLESSRYIDPVESSKTIRDSIQSQNAKLVVPGAKPDEQPKIAMDAYFARKDVPRELNTRISELAALRASEESTNDPKAYGTSIVKDSMRKAEAFMNGLYPLLGTNTAPKYTDAVAEMSTLPDERLWSPETKAFAAMHSRATLLSNTVAPLPSSEGMQTKGIKEEMDRVNNTGKQLANMIVRAASSKSTDIDANLADDGVISSVATELSNVVPGLTREASKQFVKAFATKMKAAADTKTPFSFKDFVNTEAGKPVDKKLDYEIGEARSRSGTLAKVASRPVSTRSKIFGDGKTGAPLTPDERKTIGTVGQASGDTIIARLQKVITTQELRDLNTSRVEGAFTATGSPVQTKVQNVVSEYLGEMKTNDPQLYALFEKSPTLQKQIVSDLTSYIHGVAERSKTAYTPDSLAAKRVEDLFSTFTEATLSSRQLQTAMGTGGIPVGYLPTTSDRKGTPQSIISEAIEKELTNPAPGVAKAMADANPSNIKKEKLEGSEGAQVIYDLFDKSIKDAYYTEYRSKLDTMVSNLDRFLPGAGFMAELQVQSKMKGGASVDQAFKEVTAEYLRASKEKADAKQ